MNAGNKENQKIIKTWHFSPTLGATNMVTGASRNAYFVNGHGDVTTAEPLDENRLVAFFPAYPGVLKCYRL